jgi:hypothetical protein
VNRPNPVLLTIVSVFALVFIIEFRTVLSMVGLDLEATIYFPVALGLLGLSVVALLVVPESEESESPDPGDA